MTAQQPTAPWTPERALEALDFFRESHRTGVNNPHQVKRIAIEAIESATAEIERQRARADKAEADLQCVTLTGDTVASDASLYKGNSVRHWWDKCQAYRGAFRDLDDARVEVERLKAELAKEQQQPEPVAVPSDREVGDAVNSILTSREGWERTQAIVGAFITMGRRIGARL